VSKVYLAWQDPSSRQWYPIGQLTFDGDRYRFAYTKGAAAAPNFIPFGQMKDLYATYQATDLFPLFANRLLSKSRPEYKDFLHWLNFAESEADPMALLARTGGPRETDSLLVFPCPEPSPYGSYTVHFFSHGLRYLPKETIEVVSKLQPSTPLFLMPDPQNPSDSFAVALRTDDPAAIVGYCPRYFARDFRRLLELLPPKEIRVVVVRVNPDAPIQFRLLCKLSAPWPDGFSPCSEELYELLAQPSRNQPN